jgi:hypothetical protein
VSRREAHPGLVTERDFVAAQAVRATATPQPAVGIVGYATGVLFNPAAPDGVGD